ncbi:ABC transporter ATP-binding protein [Sutterella sp.]|uniref:ABC transporter ATP-binding protein n=1 Tax=Sutterella sp. TaxID=1981025 RepID=UPI0026DED70D|nr:ABC transporter ATP-binding protein [Sutterella sp.]MDO5532492.1 ABC transporter ATP-binding protein [Sutterella sp.]
MNPILSVKDLRVTFHQDGKSAEIVKGVSFEVMPGQCLGILGESGSGKSMTMKAVLRLLEKNFEISGGMLFKGEDLNKKSNEAIRRMRGEKITMVLQNPMSCFDPLYRVGEQMAETFAEHTDWNSKKIREESIAVLKLMRIRNPEEVLRKYPHQLSGGMLQRVMIGLAVKLEPDLIVCDEPTTAIDSISRFAVMQEFLRIKKHSKAAMIFISHDLGVLSMVADRLCVMYRGRIVERGTVDEVFRNATDAYTRELIDRHSSVMNAFVRATKGEKSPAIEEKN